MAHPPSSRRRTTQSRLMGGHFIAAFCIMSLIVQTAAHAALVQVDFEGTIFLDPFYSGGAPDSLGIDGADFAARYVYDSNSTGSYIGSVSYSGLELANYWAISGEQRFTNRPSSQDDLVFAVTAPRLAAFNYTPPSSPGEIDLVPDDLRFDSIVFFSPDIVVDGSNHGSGPQPFINLPGDFIPDPGTVPLPVPTTSDLVTTSRVHVGFGIGYQLIDWQATVTVVPVPAVGWILAGVLLCSAKFARRCSAHRS